MVEEDRKKVGSKDGGRKRKWKTFARVICLLGVLYCLFIFIKIVQTGYLNWIGLTVITLIFVPDFIASIFGFAGKKHIAKVLSFSSLGVIALIIIVAVIMLLWPEGDHTWSPYQFDNELASIEAKRAIPDQDNATIRYKSLFAAIDINDCPDSLFRRDGHVRNEFSHHPWKGSDYPEVSDWLDSHTEILDELLRISIMEKCCWPINVDIFDESTVPYKPIRYCARLITIAGNRDLGEGRFQKALEKSFCLLRIAEHLYQQTLNVDFHIGFRHELAGLQIIRNVLVASEVSQDDMDIIARHLPAAANTWNTDISALLEFEELRFAQLMAQVYEINEHGKVRFTTSFRPLSENAQDQQDSGRLRKLMRLYWLMNMPLNPQGVWDMAEKESAKLARFLEPGPALGIDKYDDSLFWLLFDLPRMFSNTARWYSQNMCFDKSLYTDLAERYAKQMTQCRGTWLLLGLRKYKNVHGRWPTSLELASDYTPNEAFLDPTGNDAFVYTLDGDGFKLYSKGPNGIDEGGRNGFVRDLNRSEDDIALWPLNQKGDRK